MIGHWEENKVIKYCHQQGKAKGRVDIGHAIHKFATLHVNNPPIF